MMDDVIIKEKKYKSINVDFNNTIKYSKESTHLLKNYNPFDGSDILISESSNSVIYFLLKNGTVICLGNLAYCNKKISSNLPFEEKFYCLPIKSKVIDISCGREHALCLTEDYKIFSWGNNYYGQLGIENFSCNFDSTKNEPVEIDFFKKMRVVSIKAEYYNSYCVTSENKIYGWGSNDNGQIYQETDQTVINAPRQIILNEEFSNLMITMKKSGTHVFACDGKLFLFKFSLLRENQK